MRASTTLREARERQGLSLRELAARASTSHSTLAAYEAGRNVPTVATFDRILSAAGFAAEVSLRPRHRGTAEFTKGDELLAVLELAEQFPARHDSELAMPVFGRTETP